jgi:hypothetical protein
VGSVFRALMGLPLLRPILRPLARLIVGMIAIPLFRLFLKKVVRLQELDAELEKDLEQWFRASLVLLVATRNMEDALFPFLEHFNQGDEIGMGLRIMLAVSVVEMMPDQELFAVIHPGPPSLTWNRHVFVEIWQKKWLIVKGLACQHLNRSSPVFAILAAIVSGWIGWLCYGMALAQYLFIGLVTTRDKALDVLSKFDRAVAERRRELLEEFEIVEKPKDTTPADQPAEETPAAKTPSDPPSAEISSEPPKAT